MKKLQLILALFFLLTPAFAQGIPDDHQEIFAENFSGLLTLTTKPDSTDENMLAACDKLLQFAKDYPDSKFAKDAQYLGKFILFTGALMAQDKDKASKLMKDMEGVVRLYPDASLDEFTCEKWKEILGEKSSRAIYIPFKFILPYMRGLMGFEFKDYAAAISNFSFLKDSLDFKKDNAGILAEEVYLPLVLSYQLTNDPGKFKEVAQEAIERFPDTHLGQSMQRVLEKISPQ